MGHRLEVNDGERIVYIRLTDRVDADVLMDVVRDMEERGVRTYHQLWDFTGIEAMVIGPNDIQDVASTAIERQERHGDDVGRIATVVQDDVYYAVVRLVQHRAARRGVAAEVFGDIEEARAWLLAE